mgnify:CR=1 FL=1
MLVKHELIYLAKHIKNISKTWNQCRSDDTNLINTHKNHLVRGAYSEKNPEFLSTQNSVMNKYMISFGYYCRSEELILNLE